MKKFVKLERKLTKDDVGKRVKYRNGDVSTIDTVDDHHTYPVETEESAFTLNGYLCSSETKEDIDIIEIEEEINYGESAEEWREHVASRNEKNNQIIVSDILALLVKAEVSKLDAVAILEDAAKRLE